MLNTPFVLDWKSPREFHASVSRNFIPDLSLNPYTHSSTESITLNNYLAPNVCQALVEMEQRLGLYPQKTIVQIVKLVLNHYCSGPEASKT